MVKTRALLVPPLVQPKFPEFPLGVLTVTLAVPAAEITVVVSVACRWVLLTTRVVSGIPLITTTEAETNSAPYTSRTKPGWISASVSVVTDREPMIGAGRELPHRGLSELQACRIRQASRSAVRGRREALILFLWDRVGVRSLSIIVADYEAIRTNKVINFAQ
jgi:hypothetical protein